MATSFCSTLATCTAGGGGAAGAAALRQAAFASRGTSTRVRFHLFIALALFTLRAEAKDPQLPMRPTHGVGRLDTSVRRPDRSWLAFRRGARVAEKGARG